MTSSAVPNGGEKTRKSLRKRIVSGLSSSKKKDDAEQSVDVLIEGGGSTADRNGRGGRNSMDRRRAKSTDINQSKSSKTSKLMRKGGGIVRRIRSLSRSRARSSKDLSDSGNSEERPKTIVTVTSCRSDGYYNQKAPGSTSKLPRKAPTNLKLFHELAVGIKDAYAAVGQTPTKPVLVNEDTGDKMNETEFEAKCVLWEFIGNIDFVSFFFDMLGSVCC